MTDTPTPGASLTAPPAPSTTARAPSIFAGKVGKMVDFGGGVTVKVKAQVTRPLLKIDGNVPVAIYIEGPVFKGEEMKQTKDGAKMEPADLAHVVNLVTGEFQQIIVMTGLHDH